MVDTAVATSHPDSISYEVGDAGQISIFLKGNITIAEAKELHGVLMEALSADNDVNLHGANIEKIDAAALQLIGAFIAALQSRNHSISWSSASEALVRASSWVGMSKSLVLKDTDVVRA